MNIKRHLPNLFTLGNLLCGTIAVIFAVTGDFTSTAIFVASGIGFDFFDGFIARLLQVQGELGKQLDSLADMVTSGVVPGIVMLQLLQASTAMHTVGYFGYMPLEESISIISFFGLLVTLAACYRLGKFNIDERQSESFIGLPTPAMTLFIVSLPLIVLYAPDTFFADLIHNTYFLIAITLIFSWIMNAEIKLFSLKFASYRVNDNITKYVFLIVSLILVVIFQIVSVPLIIGLYVLISIFKNINIDK
ncbi:phosphatidylcholine/phosphatidylserine synthase [Tenacibaculum sp. SG-28]|uniref:CDP-alcohol phosphatidyltransferase family protein n=1 Tax=Tenacibaculum sp. SG-28 TaxID=754426 RepID=UPI0018EADB3A|nr:CDP-alcohol phosphatidyltransferase family protein [Tenacibaculum sp. SG-28]